jgi:hypothetical protein
MNLYAAPLDALSNVTINAPAAGWSAEADRAFAAELDEQDLQFESLPAEVREACAAALNDSEEAIEADSECRRERSGPGGGDYSQRAEYLRRRAFERHGFRARPPTRSNHPAGGTFCRGRSREAHGSKTVAQHGSRRQSNKASPSGDDPPSEPDPLAGLSPRAAELAVELQAASDALVASWRADRAGGVQLELGRAAT